MASLAIRSPGSTEASARGWRIATLGLMAGADEERGDDLLDVLVERLAGAGLPDATADLVLAAALGENELNEALGGQSPTTPAPSASAAEDATAKRTYLAGITVNGFRGIAGEARLGLTPGPGLTLVVGRNGSGKSTFAEACELALTGTTLRWHGKKTKVWQDGWANLHHDGARAIVVDLLVDGKAGQTKVRHQWDPSAADVGAAATTMQAKGEPAGPMSTSMAQAVANYRPFLSYNELGGLLEDGPSRLYDAVAHVLGLQLFVDTEARLTAARKRVEETTNEAKRVAKDLESTLAAAATGDDRAIRCLAPSRSAAAPTSTPSRPSSPRTSSARTRARWRCSCNLPRSPHRTNRR